MNQAKPYFGNPGAENYQYHAQYQDINLEQSMATILSYKSLEIMH